MTTAAASAGATTTTTTTDNSNDGSSTRTMTGLHTTTTTSCSRAHPKRVQTAKAANCAKTISLLSSLSTWCCFGPIPLLLLLFLRLSRLLLCLYCCCLICPLARVLSLSLSIQCHNSSPASSSIRQSSLSPPSKRPSAFLDDDIALTA